MSQESFEYTQNVLIRMDLKLSRGKLCGQVAHAAVAAAEEARRRHEEWWKGWMKEGQRKIILKVKGLNELLQLKHQAEALGLPTVLIQDKGLTEVPPGTVTCLGIGPAPTDLVDKVSRSLPLL